MSSVIEQPYIVQQDASTLVVCVPDDWTNDEIRTYANVACDRGLSHGWLLRSDDTENEMEFRIPCCSRESHVHVLLFI